MRNTPQPPPVNQRASDELIEELCIALRDVGVSTRFLPYSEPDPDVAGEVSRVQELIAELKRRGFDVAPRLARLTEETGWLMNVLYEECLRFPAIRPWVRAKDGLRVAMRCEACDEREHPDDDRKLRICDSCVLVLEQAIATRSARENLLLYRTYNTEARCRHADGDTVLGVYPWHAEWSEGFPVGQCRECLDEEKKRRKAV